MVDKAPRTAFVCQQCGRAAPRWLGQCPACGAWNALVEEAVRDTRRRSDRSAQASAAPRPLVAVAAGETLRRSTGLGELDGVLGGGLVQGSVVLLAGVFAQEKDPAPLANYLLTLARGLANAYGKQSIKGGPPGFQFAVAGAFQALQEGMVTLGLFPLHQV